jgi:hypothetical protein
VPELTVDELLERHKIIDCIHRYTRGARVGGYGRTQTLNRTHGQQFVVGSPSLIRGRGSRPDGLGRDARECTTAGRRSPVATSARAEVSVRHIKWRGLRTVLLSIGRGYA